jgi:hypothetical protein
MAHAEPPAYRLLLVQTAQELVQAGNWLSLTDMADELLRFFNLFLVAEKAQIYGRQHPRQGHSPAYQS